VYQVEARIFLMDFENGSKAPVVTGNQVSAVTNPNWETAIAKGLGKGIGTMYVPLTGYFTSDGKDAVLGQASPLGIDGVLEIPGR
jgi:hypothetical protein